MGEDSGLMVSRTAVLAWAGPLLVSAALPGLEADVGIVRLVGEALEGSSLPVGDPLRAARVLAALYGGVILSYNLDGLLVPLSRALPDWPVRVVDGRPCEPTVLGVDELLRAWALLLRGEGGALERLGRCSVAPEGLALAVGEGELLPPVGFVSTPESRQRGPEDG